jgi:hypothetical protein
VEALETGSSSDSTSWDLRRRYFLSTVFTAILYSQVEDAELPRNELRSRLHG